MQVILGILGIPFNDLHTSVFFSSYGDEVVDLIKFQYGVFSGDSFQRGLDDQRRFWGLQAAVADKEVQMIRVRNWIKVQFVSVFKNKGLNIHSSIFIPSSSFLKDCR